MLTWQNPKYVEKQCEGCFCPMFVEVNKVGREQLYCDKKCANAAEYQRRKERVGKKS